MTTKRYEAPDLLSREEAADIFGIPVSRLRAWEDSGRLTVVRLLTGHRRYHRADIAALVEAHARKEAELLAADQPPPPEPEPAPAQPTRLGARRAALEALHAADVAGTDARDVLPEDAPAYATTLVDGVQTHREQVDATIEEAAQRWRLDRMPVVDRNVLRIAVFELLYTDVPTGAVVDQAVTLAKMLSTESSGRFVNGILGTIARRAREA